MRRAGSAALDLCNVASGRFDGFWEFNLNPWDTAAGVLIVEEAGGKVTDFSGGAFQIASRETVASNGLVHDALLHEFQEIFAGRGLEELPSPVTYANDRTLVGRLNASVTNFITHVGSSLLERKIEKRPDKVRLQGRILFLTEDPELIREAVGGLGSAVGYEESGQQSQTSRRHFYRRDHSRALLLLL